MSIQITPLAIRGQAKTVDLQAVLPLLIESKLGFDEFLGVFNFLQGFLPTCKARLLDELLKLAPDQPIGRCERMILVQRAGVGRVEGTAKDWPRSVFSKHKLFPGYQPGYRVRRDMKYGDVPGADAPLSAWVAKMLNHAKAKWSAEIDRRDTKKQFKDWLPDYLDNDRLCWTGHPGLVTAREILRVACKSSELIPA